MGEGDRELRASIACDAQTSGGLLLCVPADQAAACLRALCDGGLHAAHIGEMRGSDGEVCIVLT
jgi:selenophosphate synthase